ncbi:MAG: hypothetical protein Q4D87_06965 [Actinomycetaceae bacterium]|nr:hypothetical protein [Actinomycetaceae bacterium]
MNARVNRIRAYGEGESGRISLLVLGLSVLVIALVLTSMAATTIHVQRRQLLTCADAVALSISGVASAPDYYAGTENTVAQATLQAKAQDAFNMLQTTTCDVGTTRRLTAVSIQDTTAVVEMNMTPRVPVFGAVLDFINQPLTVSVASTAKMH